ncbi:MAG: radical SAM protein [Planctomycetota bacterium]|jgi:molybdenum cofactor biosynthesis enzyme MoaA
MKTHTFSIVVGTSACNAGCPWCISKMTCSDAPKSPVINRTRFRTACQIVQQARDGLVNVLLTGKGEPMLFMDQIDEYLEMMRSYSFPLVDLQTNGTLIDMNIEALTRWADAGMLTLVCISIAHWEPQSNNELMDIRWKGYDYRRAVDQLHNAGLAVRLNCTMQTKGLWNAGHVDALVEECRKLDVDQLTVRDVDVPETARPEGQAVKQYAMSVKPNRFQMNWLQDHLLFNGAVELLKLPHGASVYDYNGQNLCVSNCLTDTTDADDIRQVIFFPDGRIAYDWKYPGARIL